MARADAAHGSRAGIATGALARRFAAEWLPLLIGLGLLALLSLTLRTISTGFDNFILTMLINLTVVVGIYIFVGNSGVVSFGQISFMALGAYAAALVTIPFQQKEFLLPNLPNFIASAHMGTIPSILLGGGLAAVIGAILAVPLMRMSGIAASIATLAVLVITWVVLGQWDALTGGKTALVGVPVTTTVTSAVVWTMLAIAGALLFQRSRIGLRLRASREDPVAAHGVGIGIVRERIIAFTLSAFVVGVGGGLYGHRLGAFAPDDFYFHLTFFTIAMLVVGGINSLSGAIAGTIVVSVIQEILGRLENGEGVGPLHVSLRDGVTDAVLATLVLVILIFRPEGITGGREIGWPGGRARLRLGSQREAPAAASFTPGAGSTGTETP
jgi:branched-chain amino acid transport system permease protein